MRAFISPAVAPPTPTRGGAARKAHGVRRTFSLHAILCHLREEDEHDLIAERKGLLLHDTLGRSRSQGRGNTRLDTVWEAVTCCAVKSISF